jgi:hypothetical protein
MKKCVTLISAVIESALLNKSPGAQSPGFFYVEREVLVEFQVFRRWSAQI